MMETDFFNLEGVLFPRHKFDHFPPLGRAESLKSDDSTKKVK
jgi:hypothetical protein